MRRRHDALGLATDQTEGELRGAVVAHAEQWTADLDASIGDTNAKISDALDRLADLLDERAKLTACRDFVTSAGRRWKFAPGIAGTTIGNLINRLRRDLLDE